MLLARRVAWCCSIVAVAAVSTVSQADTAWTAFSGQLVWQLNGKMVNQAGLDIRAGASTVTGDFDQHLHFEIADESSMTVISNEVGFDHISGGVLEAAESMTISTALKSIEVSKIRLAIRYSDDKDPVVVISGTIDDSAIDLLVHPFFKTGFTQEPALLYAETSDALITSEFAAALDRSDLAGKTLGSFQFFANVAWSGGDEPTPPSAPSGAAPRGGITCNKPVGQDLIVGELQSSLGNPTSEQINGVWYDTISVGTTSCNIGDVVLTWEGSSGFVHPAIGQNLFRLMDGRFEQIGQSWLKHGFTVAAGNACGCGCTGPGGPTLHPGCSDPYGPGLNNSQNSIKPKWRVNPTTGVHVHGSNPGFSGTVARRLMIRHTDINPTLNPGARFFIEGQYVHEEDAQLENDNNNASYRELSISAAGANEFTASSLGTTQTEECGIRAWQDVDPTVTETDVEVANDGLYIVAAKATDIGGGVWHYEYAVQNLNGNRGMSSFIVPISPAANVTNIGFHDVDYHDGDGENSSDRDGTDWPGVFANGLVSWNMVDVGNNSNALLWGTLYNFRFDADVEPSAELGEITMNCFRPMAGNPDSFTALTVVPEPSAVAIAVEGGAAPDLLATCQSTDVVLRIEDGAETFDSATPMLWYSYDGGSFLSQALAPMGGDLFTATLPAPSCGDSPRYYFTAQSTTGTLVSLPGEAVATNTFFNAAVGFEEINTYLETNFESGLPAGWSQEGLWNISSTCSSVPTSACGDSGGSNVAYFGQTSVCNYDTGEFLNDTMYTAPIALPASEQILLTYCSAFERDTTTIGDWPKVSVTPDGQATVIVDQPAVGAFPGAAASWQERVVDLTAFAGQTITLEFNFNNIFPTNDAFLGWMIDNVSVRALEIDCIPGCGSPDGDMNNDGSANGVDLHQFASALLAASTDAQDVAHGDFSGNGTIDNADVNDMVATLLGL